MTFRPGLLSVLFTTCLGLSIQGQAGPATPLFIATTAPLDASRLQTGSLVLGRVLQSWSGPDCTLQPGVTVQGRVESVERRSKVNPISRVELVFGSADCNGRPDSPVRLEVVALIAPLANPGGQSGVTEAPPLADTPGLAIGGSTTGSNNLRSISGASSLNSYSARPLVAGLPAYLHRGEVLHLPELQLAVAGGIHGGSVVSNKRHEVRLERGTILLLTGVVPDAGLTGQAQLLPRAAKVSASGPQPALAMSAVAELPDRSEVCAEECTQVRPAEVANAAAVRLLSLRALRYLPHDRRLRTDFNRETTLTYLSEDTLLCTFDPHFLREHDTSAEDGARTIRAVLIDPRTLKIKHVVEWRTRGNDAYLWRAGNGHVLVHIGHDLQLLDGNLNPLHSMRVHGRIAFAVASPSGDRIVVGTIRERYSAEARDRFTGDLAEEPEEPVEVRVLDASMKVVAETERTTLSPLPLLTDTGELRLIRKGSGRWKLTIYRWDRSEVEVSTLKSSCRPQLSVPTPDLIFAVGCSTAVGHWYRMMRLDGRAVLKADSPSDELMQTSDEASQREFAVRLVHAAKAVTNGQPIGRDDLVQEDVGVYRRSDGHALTVIRTKDFALGHDTYALSPEGNSLVIAGSQELQFYSLQYAR